MKQDLKPRNDKDQKLDLWIRFYDNGNVYIKGIYINDVKYGYWIDNWINKPEITFYLK